jgi:iron-sulfur cluster insertion protein
MEKIFNITEKASREILRLVKNEKSDLKLIFFRITVESGGCSGFQYNFSIDYEKKGDDLEFERNKAFVLIDEASFSFLNGTELDYIEDLASCTFVLKNPNASMSCGCGNSFSV